MDVRTYGRLERPDQQSWAITAEPHVMMRVKRIFPRVRATAAGSIVVQDTPEVARDLEWILSRWPLDMPRATQRHLAARAVQHRESLSAVLSILNGTPRTGDLLEPAREPREYQVQAADIALTTGRLLLVDDVGLGKSMTSLLMLRDPAALPALVVTLTHLPEQWLRELSLTFPWLVGHAITTGPVYDPAARHGGHDPDVLVISYSKLDKWQNHLAGQVKTVVFDEVQELRKGTSLKYVAAQRIANSADYRMGLTATPVYNYAGEIHTVVEVLAPDVLGSRDEFIREWAGVPVGMSSGGNISVKEATALGAYLRDQGLMLRRTRRDVGREIPEPIQIPQQIDTDEEQVASAVRDAVTMARLILADTSTNTERWHASGELDWKMRHATGVAKARYVADFVRMLLESEERVVLYGWHRDVYDIWAERLSDLKPVFYTGEESPKQKQASFDAFCYRDSRVLCVSLRAGAGLDGLQKYCSVAVFGELDWSPGVHEQCIGRLWRDGQDETVVAYYLISDAGTDPLMTEVLDLKRQQADSIRDGERQPFVAATAGDRIQRLAEAVLEASQ